MQEEDNDLLQPQRSVTLLEFLPRNFLEHHSNEVLEITACHAVNIVEVDNSNEIKQMTSVFDCINPSTTRSSVFQGLSMATKEEEN